MVTYNKEEVKGGRKLTASGPRNMQTRALALDTSEDIKELKKEITKLTETKNLVSSGYSQQQVDTMLNDAIGEVSIDLEKKYVSEINILKVKLQEASDLVKELKQELEKKNTSIDDKDKVILNLTTKITSLVSTSMTGIQTNIVAETENNRPSMDRIYLDPSLKGKENKLESHVTIQEVKSTSKATTNDNVNKLKDLMGKKFI